MSRDWTPGPIGGGILATFVAMSAGYWLPAIDLPRLDFATLNGNLVVPESSSASFSWTIGLLQTFGFGALLAHVYGLYVEPHLPGPAWMRASLWGLVLAVVSGLTVFPLLYGVGIFGADRDGAMPVALVLWYLLWGLVLGLSTPAGDSTDG